MWGQPLAYPTALPNLVPTSFSHTDARQNTRHYLLIKKQLDIVSGSISSFHLQLTPLHYSIDNFAPTSKVLALADAAGKAALESCYTVQAASYLRALRSVRTTVIVIEFARSVSGVSCP